LVGSRVFRSDDPWVIFLPVEANEDEATASGAADVDAYVSDRLRALEAVAGRFRPFASDTWIEGVLRYLAKPVTAPSG
jgi:hypothetical protein